MTLLYISFFPRYLLYYREGLNKEPPSFPKFLEFLFLRAFIFKYYILEDSLLILLSARVSSFFSSLVFKLIPYNILNFGRGPNLISSFIRALLYNFLYKELLSEGYLSAFFFLFYKGYLFF